MTHTKVATTMTYILGQVQILANPRIAEKQKWKWIIISFPGFSSLTTNVLTLFLVTKKNLILQNFHHHFVGKYRMGRSYAKKWEWELFLEFYNTQDPLLRMGLGGLYSSLLSVQNDSRLWKRKNLLYISRHCPVFYSTWKPNSRTKYWEKWWKPVSKVWLRYFFFGGPDVVIFCFFPPVWK